MPKIQSTPEINSIIVALYESGLDTYQVAKKCNCSQTFIMKTLKKCHISRRTTQSYITKYVPNENFFDSINTEEKAYILGFLYADGNNYVKNNNYEVSIKLQLEDLSILEKMRDLISPDSQVKKVFDKSTYKFYYLFKINSKVLSQQLSNLGCVPAKSLILQFPSWIDLSLQHHFIRGYFDGDGSLYSKKPNKTNYVNWGWQITSTQQFCETVKDIIQELDVHCSQSLSRPKTNKITTTLSVGGNLQVKKVLDWLYQDATIYLPRKFDKYQEFIQSRSSSKSSIGTSASNTSRESSISILNRSSASSISNDGISASQ